jgi:glutathione S-transferase
MLKLYYGIGTCALAPHIALQEAGADYVTERIDMKANQQNSTEYLAVNPRGRVPALATDRGVLTENPAILSFIAQTFPKAGLAPLNDPFAFAEMQSFNVYLCSTVHIAHAHKMRGARWASEANSLEDMKLKVPENMRACMAMVENNMMKGPWVMGEAYTICDPYLFVVSTWARGDGVDLAEFPKVSAHREHMKRREAVQAVLEMEKA